MNYYSLASILGRLLVLLSAFLFTFAIIAEFAYPSEGQGFYFVLSTFITLSIGLISKTWGDVRRALHIISFREGFAVAGLGWVLIALFSSLPAWLSNDIPSFTDAFFESMSGFTTTGASILTDIESRGHTILLWRSFSHWLGGMGIIVLTLAILPALGIGGLQLYKAEVPGPTPDKLVPKVAATARLLYSVYTLLSIILFFLLWLGDMNTFESLCHVFGTMGTGGFSPLNHSIGSYTLNGNPHALYFEIVIIVFMFLAGANFSLHYKALTGDFRSYAKDPEFKYYFSIVVVAISTISLNLYFNSSYHSWPHIIRTSSFSVVSIITTTGYATDDFNLWPSYSKFVLVFAMFIGGSTGSTGGGIKVLRIAALVKEAVKEVQHVIHPRKIYTIRFGEEHLSKDLVRSINAFFLIFILIYILSILALSFTNLDFETIATMVIACLANIGPGLAKVGPMENYAELPAYAKWLLSFLMVLGRLELFPVLALMLPRAWVR